MAGRTSPQWDGEPHAWVPFEFSERKRAELELRGVPRQAHGRIERSVSFYLTARHHGGQVSPNETRASVAYAQEGVAHLDYWLGHADTSTRADVVERLALSGGPDLDDLRRQLQQLEKALAIVDRDARDDAKPGRPKASAKTGLATEIAQTLANCDVPVTAERKGPFVVSLEIVFEECDPQPDEEPELGKKPQSRDVRPYARQALERLGW